MAPDCDRPVVAKGFCAMHWQRQRHGVPLDKLVQKPTGGPCDVESCPKPARKRGWCVMHYERWAKHGDPLTTFKLVRKHLVCTIDGCTNPTKTALLCKSHRLRQLLGQPLDEPLRVMGVRQPCAGKGCDREAADLGLCRRCRENQRYRENPEPQKAKTARRRAIAGELTQEERELSDAYRHVIRFDPCVYCGNWNGAETDHIFPLAKGGTDHWWNLTRACAPCNRRKHAHCGTHWHLKRGTWVVPPRAVPAVTEAGPGDRRVAAAPGVDTVRRRKIRKDDSQLGLFPDHDSWGAA